MHFLSLSCYFACFIIVENSTSAIDYMEFYYSSNPLLYNQLHVLDNYPAPFPSSCIVIRLIDSLLLNAK